jgi:hypothetical protein
MSAIEKRYTGKKREVQGWFFTHTEYQCVQTDLTTGTSHISWERTHRGNTLPWIISTFRRNKGEPIMSRTDPRPGPTDPTADQRCPNNQFMPRMPGCNADPQTCPIHSPHAKQVQLQLAAATARCAELERRLEVPASSDATTYPMPEHGWTCFHCGETFTTPGGARLHFGTTPDAKPGCYLKVELGDERGWLARIRELEEKTK